MTRPPCSENEGFGWSARCAEGFGWSQRSAEGFAWSQRCAEGFGWSQRCAEGFALAATVAKDRGAEQAALQVREAGRAQLCGVARELAGLSKGERRARVTRLIERGRVAAQQGERCTRALSLLTANASPSQARAWLQRTSLPRPGFVPEPGLLALLLRIAQTEPQP